MRYLRQNFNRLALTFFTVLALLFSLAPTLAYAATKDDLQGGINTASGGTPSDPGGDAATQTDSIISTVINILTAAVGVAAIVMIVVAGFRYVTSGGKQESVTSAKNTILYAVIGLVIVALAQIIVHFVLNKTQTASTPQCVNHKIDSGLHAGDAC